MAISLAEAERRLNSGGDISAISAAQWRQLEQIEARNNAAAAPNPLDAAAVQAPSVTYNGLNPSDGTAVYNPGDGGASEQFNQWARDIGARGAPAAPAPPPPPPRSLQSTQTKRTYGGKVQIIAYYSDGSQEVIDEWIDKSAGEDAADIFRTAGLDDAFVQRLMRTIDDVYNKNINPSEGQILSAIYNSDAYKDRFKANEVIRKRIADGMGRPGDRLLSPKEYIDLENTYRNILQERSMPEGYYDSPDDFVNLISNSISASEFTARVDTAASALNQADASVVNALQQYYNLTKSDLVAYLLDPARAMPIINARSMQGAFGLNSADQLQRIYEASEVGGMAGRQNLGVGREMAEEIVDLGKKDQAEGAFQVAGAADADLKRLGSLYGGSLDFKDLVKETLNLSGGVESGLKRRKFASKERAAFSQESALDRRSLRRMQDF